MLTRVEFVKRYRVNQPITSSDVTTGLKHARHIGNFDGHRALKSIVSRWKKLEDKAFRLLIDTSLPFPGSAMHLARELRSTFRSFPTFSTENALPSEASWYGNMNRLRWLVLEQDPRRFIRWDIIQETMFVWDVEYLHTEIDFLSSLPNWNQRWFAAIRESPIGAAPPSAFLPVSSGNLIHHAYHLAQFEEKTGLDISKMDFVLEFGGGYGSMCRLFHNLGYKGRYLIFDLPAFSALQRYYLRSLEITLRPPNTFKVAQSDVFLVSALDDLEGLIASGDIATGNAMFVGTWSISEAPIEFRQSILSLTKGFQAFLIAYQDRFGEVNNFEFFDRWSATRDDILWKRWGIDHIPGNNYLVGRKKEI